MFRRDGDGKLALFLVNAKITQIIINLGTEKILPIVVIFVNENKPFVR